MIGPHAYTPRAGSQAKRLRREMTFTEKLLWAELRKLPVHVRKQAPVGRYIADFLIHAAKLIVEVDGVRHDLEDAQIHDAIRDDFLRSEGFRVVRFTDAQVIADTEGAARQVLELCSLPPSGGEGRGGGFSTRDRRRDRIAPLHPALRTGPPSPALPPRGGKGED